jgi:hypothetical protein
MTKHDFLKSLVGGVPPSDLSPLLQVLWWDKNGDWDRAHAIAQSIPTQNGARVHAYLHRVEGDRWNADYWYHRAGQSYPDDDVSPENEWESLLNEWTDGPTPAG